MVVKVNKMMPEGMRKKSVVKQGAKGLIQSPLLDYFDCKGENPYTVTEIVEGEIWQVGYKMENTMYTRPEAKKMMKLFGFGWPNEAYNTKVLEAAKKYGDDAVEILKEDLKSSLECMEKQNYKKEEIFNTSLTQSHQNMIVVKLKSGSILLYAPVRMHKENPELILSWIESLGSVDWIVAPSSAHTMSLPDVLAAFPNAKIIGAELSQEKLKFVNAIDKYHYLSTDSDDLAKANEELKGEDIEIINIDGDVCAHAILCIVDNRIILECDLIYGHHDGEGLLSTDGDTLKKWRPEDALLRLFKFSSIEKPNSPNGFLPNYRFWTMDPKSFGPMAYTPPNPDGSDLTKMATSLRNVLAKPFSTAVGVHINKMSGDDFRKSMDAAWNWLDGKPLLLK